MFYNLMDMARTDSSVHQRFEAYFDAEVALKGVVASPVFVQVNGEQTRLTISLGRKSSHPHASTSSHRQPSAKKQ